MDLRSTDVNKRSWKHRYQVRHTTTLFPLSDHYILSQEWTFIVSIDHLSWYAYGTIINQV